MKKSKYVVAGWIALCTILITPFSVCGAEEIGEITRLRGTAQVARQTAEQPIPASAGMALHLNDEVRTAARSSLRIKLKDDSVLTLGPSGHLQLSHFEFEPQDETRSALFDMFKGKLRVFARDLETYQKKDFKIKTPTAICGVRGTLFMVWVQSDTVTRVYCFKNDIEVANVLAPEEIIMLTPGYSSDIIINNPPAPPVFTLPPQQQEVLRELGEGQGTDKPVAADGQTTPKVPLSGSGYGTGGLPSFGGDVAREGDVGSVPGTAGTGVALEDALVTPDQQGSPVTVPPSGLPSPPAPPSH